MAGIRAALVVDRNPEVREIVRRALENRGLITLGAASAAEAMEHLRSAEVRLIFLELEIPASPLESLIARAGELQPAPLLIGMTSASGGTTAKGVPHDALFDILRKPLQEELVCLRADRAIERLALLAEERRLRDELKRKLGFHGLVGRSAAMEMLRQKLAELSGCAASAWFTGEEGTGKKLAARIVHDSSPGADDPFTVIDCSASEVPHAGNGQGTVYLDNPAALPSGTQQRLLRQLRSTAGPQLRFLAGSREEPLAEIKLGRLLPELHALLAATSLHLPPLRERGNDIALLASHFIATIAEINRLPPLGISHEAMALLDRYSWPGNVRELRDCMEKAVILAADGKIRAHDLPARIRRQGSPDRTLDSREELCAREFRDAKRVVVDSFERAYLRDLMSRFGGNVTLAAKHGGMLRSALQRLLRKHALRSAQFRRKRAARVGARQVEPFVE